MAYFARTDAAGRPCQPLADHLRGVAALAERFAAEARPGDAAFAESARVASLLHDLGKYRPEFQQLLAGRPRGEATRHKQAGAARASALKRTDAAFAIGGHHGGMPDKERLRELIEQPGDRDIADKVWPIAVADCPEIASIQASAPPVEDALGFDIRTRLLFSCLVDADWLNSASAVDPGAERDPVRFADHAERWLAGLLSFVRTRAASCEDADVRACRGEVLDACLGRATDPPGMFSLTVPTGGGKTLSAMAFALKHAIAHGLRRIIYVAPYLSIIEQNAGAIRAAIGEADAASGAVLEHHSLSESGDEHETDSFSSARDRLSENWDAPVVITTSVQFFESLFANSPRRCRKVHNIARSVVILDECQSLPRDLVAPTVEMLRAVQPYFCATLVLCTATQPAWEKSDALPCGLESVREIAPDPAALANRLRRVRVAWPPRGAPAWTWEETAERMTADGESALCIVNTKAAACAVFLALRDRRGRDDGAFHLSTSMCPEHRRRVLAECSRRLQERRPCLLVSTQLIEAGVDIDFPLVLRELGPLDSIVQAAGRCNREGRLGREGGRVVVFRSAEGGLPPGQYTLATGTTGQWLETGKTPDIADPEMMRPYFTTLYYKSSGDSEEITPLRKSVNFPEVARRYRLIDEETVSVVALGWEEERARIEGLLDALARSPTRSAFRSLAPYSVNLYRRDSEAFGHCVRSWSGTQVTVCDSRYDASLGLVKPATGEALLA
ncbi:MAG: CRISPR-associated helicase Cas3' [Phycisphaerales bacterium]|nr:CRISPR-associated helicase Cas3' [Phycisphaerales bacterium]